MPGNGEGIFVSLARNDSDRGPGFNYLDHTGLCTERGGGGPINADYRGGVTCLI